MSNYNELHKSIYAESISVSQKNIIWRMQTGLYFLVMTYPVHYPDQDIWKTKMRFFSLLRTYSYSGDNSINGDRKFDWLKIIMIRVLFSDRMVMVKRTFGFGHDLRIWAIVIECGNHMSTWCILFVLMVIVIIHCLVEKDSFLSMITKFGNLRKKR